MRHPRNLKLQAVVALLFFPLFVGCDEGGNEPVEPEPTPTECQLKSLTSGTDITLTITYNSKGLPIEFKHVIKNGADSRTDVFEYDGSDNVVKISSKNGYMEYAYNAENKVISTKAYPIINGSPVISYNALHYYNTKGQLDSTVMLAGGSPPPFNYDRFEYDEDGNVIKVFSKNGGPEKLVRENLEFDDKKASYGNYYSYFVFLGTTNVDLTRLVNPFVGNHNVTKAKILTVGGTWTDVQYTFEYNDLGYPTKLTTSGLTTFITNYGYECK